MEMIGKALYYGIFYLVLAAILFSYYRNRTGEREALGREAGRELRGIAVLMVLLGHLSYLFGYVKLPVTPALGAPAVDLFLFLSGFGLVSSYTAKGLKGFAGRRLSVILVPYAVTTVLKLPVMPKEGLNWKLFFTNILPLNTDSAQMIDTSMWYVQYILLCYLVFFLVFSIPGLSAGRKVLLLCMAGAGLAVYNGFVYYYGEMPDMLSLSESYSHHLSFPLGAAFFLIYEKAKKFSLRVYLAAALGAFLVFQFAAYPGVGGYVEYYLSNIGYVVFLVSLVAAAKYFGRRSVWLERLGGLSYYIYLNELAVMGFFYRNAPLPPGITALLVILVSIAAAVPVKLFCEWIMKKLSFLPK